MAAKKTKKKSVKQVQVCKGNKPISGKLTADSPLNRKQAAFVEEYLKDFNGTRAAIRAGYSQKTATVKGSALLRLVHVKAVLAKKAKERTDKVDLTADDLLFQIKAISRSNVRDYVKFGPGYVTVNESDNLTPEQAACISEVVENSSENGSQIKLKLHDKAKFVDMGMKYLGLYAPEKRNVSGVFTIETGVRRVGDED